MFNFLQKYSEIRDVFSSFGTETKSLPSKHDIAVAGELYEKKKKRNVAGDEKCFY
jgi:hypothetical protein